ncbi:MAG: RNA polymerase sigma factor [Burkholderiaceae bacterium]
MRDAPLEALPDEELMLAYAAGDADAFAQLYDRHERAVYRFLLRSVRSPDIADDLLQDTWMAVVRNAAGYAPRARFTTWLYGIARSKLIDHWRRADPVASLDDPVANDPDAALVDLVAADAAFQPEVRALSRAQARAFVEAVEALPPAQREAFLLHAEGGLALEEIAELTRVGVETVKSRLRYAMAKLRAAMEDWR